MGLLPAVPFEFSKFITEYAGTAPQAAQVEPGPAANGNGTMNETENDTRPIQAAFRRFGQRIGCHCGAPVLLALALALPAIGHSATFTQTLASSGTTTEWNDAIWGSPTRAVPTSGNDYQTATGLDTSNDSKLGVTNLTGRVRAYGGANGNPTFAGDSLSIISKTELLIKDPGTTYSANLLLNGGVVRFSPNSGSAGNSTLAGTLNVGAASYLGVVQTSASVLTVNSTITGSGLLHLAAGDGGTNSLTFGGVLSGYTGTFDIGGGNNLITVGFNQDYNLSSVDLKMGAYSTADRLNLSHNLVFKTFTFGGSAVAQGTYSASQLNALYGTGSQFLDNGGSLTVQNATTVAAKVFIIGDSTVLNNSPIVGWGQVIYHYFDPSVRFQDAAYPGESSETFITGGRWANVLSQLSTNDYLLIQFGHNDSHNPANVEATDPNPDPNPAGTNVNYYRNNLKRYIDDTRAKGAIPVFVTPMHRRSFDAGGNLLSYIVDGTGYTNDLAPYAAAMKIVAQSNNVPCVDLFTSSGAYMQQLGNDLIYSNLMYLGDGGITHFNEKGATVMAALVSQGLSEVLPAPAPPVAPKELTHYLRRNVLGMHHADLDSGVFLRPILTLEPDADELLLDWFVQPSGVILQQSTNLTTWTQWDTGATGTAGSVSFVPLTGRAFFRLVLP
jgi:lysophospholipase L1-like esterase